MSKQLTLLVIALLISGSLSAGLNFSSQTSLLKLDQGRGYLKLDTDLTNFSGRLEQESRSTNQIQGSSAIQFVDGVSSVGGGQAIFTGKLSSSSDDTICFQDNQTLIAQVGFSVPDILVQGSGNKLIGAPSFAASFSLETQSSAISLNLTTPLTISPALCNGTITLDGDLICEREVTLTGSGKLVCQGFDFQVEPGSTTWTGTCEFTQPVIVLNSDVQLSGMWIIGGEHQTSRIQGNGHLIDMTLGGTLWIRSGHGVALSDLTLKGLGHDKGTILFEDANATVTLVGSTLGLENNYTVSQGKIYFRDANAQIQIYNHDLTFVGSGSYTIDGVSVVLESFDRQKGTSGITPDTHDGSKAILINNGRLNSQTQTALDDPLYLDTASYVMTGSDGISLRRPLLAGSESSLMTFDGGGHLLKFSSRTDQIVRIGGGKTLLFKDIILRGLKPEHVQLSDGAALRFGDGAILQLESDIDLNFTLTFAASGRIDGRGHRLNATNGSGIFLEGNATLTLQDLRCTGLRNREASSGAFSLSQWEASCAWRTAGDFVLLNAASAGPWLIELDSSNLRFSEHSISGVLQHKHAEWNSAGSYLVTGSYPQISSFNPAVKSFTNTGSMTLGAGQESRRARWSPNGSYVAYITQVPNGLSVAQFDATHETLVDLTWAHSGRSDGQALHDVSWHSGGAFIATAGGNLGTNSGQLQVFRFDTGNKILSLAATATAFSSNAGYVVECSNSGDEIAIAEYGTSPAVPELKIYEFNTTTSVLTLKSTVTGFDLPYSLAWKSDDSGLILSASSGDKSVISYGYSGGNLTEGVSIKTGSASGLAYNGTLGYGIAVLTTEDTATTPSTTMAALFDSAGLIPEVAGIPNFGAHANGRIVLENTDLVLSHNLTQSSGMLEIRGDCSVLSNGKSLVYTSTLPCTICSGGVLHIGHQAALEYRSSNTLGLVLDGADAVLAIDGATLTVGGTGLTLRSGNLILQDKATLKSEGVIFDQALSLEDGLAVHILPHAQVQIDGLITVE